MNEVIDHELKCEEKAITDFQDKNYRNPDFRESRLQNAKSTYSAILQRHFPDEASVQQAYLNAIQRIEQIESDEKKVENQITEERFRLKAIPQESTPTSSLAFQKPIKKSQASPQFKRPQKENILSSAPSEVSSDLLIELKKIFEQYIAEKRRLQLRLQMLLPRLNVLPTKLAPPTNSGVALWKKANVSRNSSPPPTHNELDAGFRRTLG